MLVAQFVHPSVSRLSSRTFLTIFNVKNRYENTQTDEMKNLDELGQQYFCKICKRDFSSEYEHYDLKMAEYSDWILGADDNKNSDSSNECQIVFRFLRKKFYLEVEPHISPPSSMRFCWTEDMFENQFQALTVLLEEKNFESANAVSFGILLEIEKTLNGNEDPAQVVESETSFQYLTQLIKTRFKNDAYSALSGYMALFQTYPDFMIHTLGESIHQFIISKLFEDKVKDVSSYAKGVGGLHFLLWKYNYNSDDSTNTDTEFDNHMDDFSEKSTSLIDSIICECFNNIDFEGLSKLLQILLTSNVPVLGECLRKRTSMFNIDMDSEYEKLRGEYKPMFLMIRGTMSKLQGKYKEAQSQWSSALDCCSDVNFKYRDVIPTAIARLMIDYEFHKSVVSRLIKYSDEQDEVIPDLVELVELRKLNIWNQQSTRSVVYNVAKQNEEKIRTRFNSKGYLEKAFAFLDFSQGVDLLSGKLLALIL